MIELKGTELYRNQYRLSRFHVTKEINNLVYCKDWTQAIEQVKNQVANKIIPTPEMNNYLHTLHYSFSPDKPQTKIK